MTVLNNDNSEDFSKKSAPALGRHKRHSGSKLHHRDLRSFWEPVLGRNVYLGCLFDAKKNEILPEYSLWKEETITKNKRTSASLSSALRVFSAKSTFDRLAHTDYHDSLKLDFLGKSEFGCFVISVQFQIYVALK